MPKWCPKCDRKVEASEIVKGYVLDKTNYIRVTEDDLDRVRLESLKSIQVDNFVPWSLLEDYRMTADKNSSVRLSRLMEFCSFKPCIGRMSFVSMVTSFPWRR